MDSSKAEKMEKGKTWPIHVCHASAGQNSFNNHILICEKSMICETFCVRFHKPSFVDSSKKNKTAC